MCCVIIGTMVKVLCAVFRRQVRLHAMAAMGYVVISIDGRGSCNRGVQYESWIKHRLVRD